MKKVKRKKKFLGFRKAPASNRHHKNILMGFFRVDWGIKIVSFGRWFNWINFKH